MADSLLQFFDFILHRGESPDSALQEHCKRNHELYTEFGDCKLLEGWATRFVPVGRRLEL